MIISIINTIEDSDDRTYMENLYHEFERLMFSTAQKYIPTIADQNDVVQESIVKLIKKIAILRSLHRYALSSYIVSTTKSTSIDFLRARQTKLKYTVTIEDDTLDELDDFNLSLDEMMILSEENKALRKALDGLSEEDQMLLEGKYFYGYTNKELALLCNCKPNSIRMKLTRARRQVFEAIKEQEGVGTL